MVVVGGMEEIMCSQMTCLVYGHYYSAWKIDHYYSLEELAVIF